MLERALSDLLLFANVAQEPGCLAGETQLHCEARRESAGLRLLNLEAIGDETPFQTVILTENSTEQVKFTSMNDKAKRYTIRVRQAR